ncbi:glutathione S-transferase N-terminal domain-containing protein [Serratia sp. 2723]|uniref:glutathione S-transferase N-terminal domain-containing protein n=1 Tax=unclassified Serratia (in: enterobacteria) TaxID=2647522 RepID=UPI003D20EA28
MSILLIYQKNEQQQTDYSRLQPQKLVPVLVDENCAYVQSIAIIEYLDECHPVPKLLPEIASERAWVRAFSLIFCTDTHPLLTRRVFSLLKQLGMGEVEIQSWQMHWLSESFIAAERMLAQRSKVTIYCHGDQPGLADICLVPQCDAALRMGFILEPYPHILRIYRYCKQLAPFRSDNEIVR